MPLPAVARFFVATLDEGLTVRSILTSSFPFEGSSFGNDRAVYVFNGLLCGHEDLFVHHRLQPVLNTMGEIDAWAGFAHRLGLRLPAAIHLDTGMSRLGLDKGETQCLTEDHEERLRGIDVTAILSHLACADEPAHPMNEQQRRLFHDLLGRLPEARVSLANSAGIFLGQDYHGQLVRPGIALYGGAPQPGEANPMRTVVRLLGRVLQVRTIDEGGTVGYGATYQSARRQRIATVSVGYADGYLRSLSNRGTGYIGERPVPLVGRVSMDLITFDVTEVPEALAHPGAWVELIGSHEPLDVVARNAGTIGYELLTRLGNRFHRAHTRSDS
ncbi:MAG: alanine racemase [Rhodospirillales bacterium]|nr:alanine racemase [Rhodospirillales bacterium]